MDNISNEFIKYIKQWIILDNAIKKYAQQTKKLKEKKTL